MNAYSYAEKLAQFKSDLLLEETETIVRKHLFHGSSAILSEDKFFKLKDDVSKQFNVNTTDVFMVGSAKLGFSIKKARRFLPFSDSSDIDLAIVSRPLFETIWHDVYNYKSQSGWWPRENDFKNYIFKGWIRPDFLPPSGSFSISKEWWEFFRKITESGKFGPYKITAGIYESFFFFQGYQNICVDQCKRQEG